MKTLEEVEAELAVAGQEVGRLRMRLHTETLRAERWMERAQRLEADETARHKLARVEAAVQGLRDALS